MQTAFSIDNVSSSAVFDFLLEEGGGIPVDQEKSTLTVGFDILNRGPNHLAGLLATTDSWATWQVVHATFVAFAGDTEKWTASFSVAAEVTAFEFVVFCDDLGGDNTVPRIWNTNGGSVFQVATVTVEG